jgi:hypothetical protein
MVHFIVTVCALWVLFDLMARGKLGDALIGLLGLIAVLAVGAAVLYLPVAVFITHDREYIKFAGVVVLGGISLLIAYGVVKELRDAAKGKLPPGETLQWEQVALVSVLAIFLGWAAYSGATATPKPSKAALASAAKASKYWTLTINIPNDDPVVIEGHLTQEGCDNASARILREAAKTNPKAASVTHTCTKA